MYSLIPFPSKHVSISSVFALALLFAPPLHLLSNSIQKPTLTKNILSWSITWGSRASMKHEIVHELYIDNIHDNDNPQSMHQFVSLFILMASSILKHRPHLRSGDKNKILILVLQIFYFILKYWCCLKQVLCLASLDTDKYLSKESNDVSYYHGCTVEGNKNLSKLRICWKLLNQSWSLAFDN